jgi:hypothetical protein
MGLLAMGPVAGFAQDASPPPPDAGTQQAAAAYTTAQLDQMLAPIALYPDTLLADILMAATFPVEVVEAERWLARPSHARLRGDALVAALQPLPWDPSVKSLVPFPAILKQLNDQLDWTESLGTAFATQQPDVMAEVQVLRHQCEASGKLVTTPQLRVRHQETAVIIEPADPAVVYVPVYNPVEVFPGWAYPAYPPYYFPPYPGFYAGTVGIGIGFSVGFGVIGPLWGWGYPSWGGGGVFIDSGRYSRISYNHVGYAGGTFQHQGAIGRVGGGRFSRSTSAGGGFSRSGSFAGSAGARSGSFGRTANSRSGTFSGTGHTGSSRARAFSGTTAGGHGRGGSAAGGHGRGGGSVASHGNQAGSNRGAQSHGLARANQVAGSHGQAGRANAASHQAVSHGGGGGHGGGGRGGASPRGNGGGGNHGNGGGHGNGNNHKN